MRPGLLGTLSRLLVLMGSRNAWLRMNEDQIIARAQRDVAARRGAAAERRWSGAWRWLPPSIGLAVLLAFFVAPVPVACGNSSEASESQAARRQ